MIVLDTPPSRNALDFIDAPDRLTGFLEGRALRTLVAGSGVAARVGRGTSAMLSVLGRVAGTDLLLDIRAFLRSLGVLLDGFRAARGRSNSYWPTRRRRSSSSARRGRAGGRGRLLRRALRDAGLHVGGLVVNAVHGLPATCRSLEALAATLGPPPLACSARAPKHSTRPTRRRHDRRARAGPRRPEPDPRPPPATDVHDAAGLPPSTPTCSVGGPRLGRRQNPVRHCP